MLASAADGSARSRAADIFLADGFRSVYPVRLGLALPGTDSVELDGRPLGPGEYIFDYERGLLLLSRRPPRWTVIRVSSEVLPVRVRPEYRRYEARPFVPAAPGAPDALPVSAPDADRGELVIGGSKTIGVVVGGAEGSGLNQATRLAVDGTIEGVRIDAELSDQSSPIPPEGTTLALDELDVIRIDLSGPGWQGRFGDLDLRLPTTGFGTLERRAIGGLVSAELGPAGARVGYARPRGRVGRAVIAGRNGVQGPYVLAPDGRSATLVAGSEEVYLDGHRMTRGWDADYVIDYAGGELSFTSRHVIDRFSRIEAIYQYTLDAWERENVTGGAQFAGGGFRVGADYFREGDEPDRGGRYELTGPEREYLASIGADTVRAWLDGGTRVGDSSGSYVLDGGAYRYVGEGRGDYRVLFTLVGDSLGDYVFDDTLGAHRHVGDGRGEYVSKYRVELPVRSELGAVELGYEAGGFRTGLSGIGRRNVANLFAPGGGAVLDGAIAGRAGWDSDRVELGWRGRALAPGFSFPGGDSLVDLEYRWNGVRPEQARTLNEFAGTYRPREWLEAGADLGWLGTEVDSLFFRGLGRLRVGPAILDGGRVRTETRAGVEVRPDFGRFRPRAGWRQAWARATGRRTLEAGLGVSPVAGLELDAGYRDIRADTAETGGVLATHETGGVGEFQLSWQPGDWLRASGRAARQARHYPASALDNWQSWLTGVNIVALPRPGLRLSGDLQQSRRLVQLRDEFFRYVGPGEGDYSRDTLTGRYYLDPNGPYERVVAARGRFVPADEIALNLSGDWSTWRPLGLTGTLSRLDVSDSVPLRQASNHNLRATFRALEPVVTAWFTASGGTTLDRTLVRSGQLARRGRYRAEFQSVRVPAVELRARVELGEDSREDAAGRLDYIERSRAVGLEPVIGRRLRLEVEAGFEHSTIAEPVLYPELGEFALVALSAAVGRGWSFGERWRLRARGGVTRRTASVADLPFDVALTRPTGWTPEALLDLSHVFSEALTLAARYDYRDRPDRDADHRVSAELRAYF
ncbi:MAG: hypothetical protein R6X12_10100 [bacterium]